MPGGKKMQQKILQNQQQTLSTRQMQSLHILAMDLNELWEFIHNEYRENPTLEIMESSEERSLKMIGDYFQRSDTYISTGILSNEKPDFQDSFNPDTSLQHYLFTQLYSVSLTSSQQKTLYFLIESLDSDGFLELSAAEISLITKCPISQVFFCIDILRSMEPVGVGASDFKQALILQAKKANRCDAILITLIEQYLPQIAAGQLNKISRELAVSREKVNQYITYLKSLNPKPCRYFGCCQVQYVVPDIIISYVNEMWSVVINDKWNGSIGISNLYKNYSKNSVNPNVSAYIERKIARAKFITQCIERRRDTLRRLSKYIADQQEEFLLGDGPLKSVSAKDAAKRLGINSSTVSRAIKNKYIQTPIGTYPFKFFFEKSCFRKQNEKNYKVSREAIKNKLFEIIQSEPKKNPYNDALLAKLFAKDGICISRRTIAKYREECNIKNSYERSTNG
jgi:RNA polymerase sigma-54 factor